MLTPVLLEMGTEEQKQTFIKPTIEADMIWCQVIQSLAQAVTLPALRLKPNSMGTNGSSTAKNLDEHGPSCRLDFLPGQNRTGGAKTSGYFFAVQNGHTRD